MRKYRTWHEVLMEDLADSAEAISYLDVSLEEYQMDGDIPFFLKGIRNVVEAQGGVTAVAKRAAMSPETLSKILSSDEVPYLDTFATIVKALGCRLSIETIKDEKIISDTEPVIETESTQIRSEESQLSESDSSPYQRN